MAYEREAGGSGIKKQKIGGALINKKNEIANKYPQTTTGSEAPRTTGIQKVEQEKVGGKNDKWDNVIDYTSEKVEQPKVETPETPSYQEPEVKQPEPEVTTPQPEKTAGNMTGGPDWYNEQMGIKVPVTTPVQTPEKTTSRFDKEPDVDALKQYVSALTTRLNERKNGEKPSDYGVPVAPEDETDLKNPWEVLGNSVDSSDALDTWGNVLEDESALGNGYVKPVTTGMRGGTPPTLSSNPDEQWVADYNEAYRKAIAEGAKGADARAFAEDHANTQKANRNAVSTDQPVTMNPPIMSGYDPIEEAYSQAETEREDEADKANFRRQLAEQNARAAEKQGLMDIIDSYGNEDLRAAYDRNVEAWKGMGYSQEEAEDLAANGLRDQIGDLVATPWEKEHTLGAGPHEPEEQGGLSYYFNPPSSTYDFATDTYYNEQLNPNAGRNSTGEWKALVQEDKWLKEGYEEAKKIDGLTERDRRDYAQKYAERKAAEQPVSTEPTWQEKVAERTGNKQPEQTAQEETGYREPTHYLGAGPHSPYEEDNIESVVSNTPEITPEQQNAIDNVAQTLMNMGMSEDAAKEEATNQVLSSTTTPQREPDVSEPASSGGGVLNNIVDFFFGNDYKYNEDGTVSKVNETPESKKDRLAKQTEEMIANGTINNMPEQTGIEDVLDNIMTGGSQPETDEEKRKRLENVNNYLAENGYTPEAYNDLEKRALLEDMNNYLAENGYTPENYDAYMSQAYTTPSATSSSSGSNIPKGSTTSDPSYGQGGTVVKAPYKEGGYTEQELMDMGNKAWGTTYGYNSYEGYYRASDGHYYPVDQEKAEYYKRYGTYNGWEEPMRDYYNTFGTFYGYTPTWKSTGRNTGGGRSYSYSGGNRSSGYSYNNNYSGGNNSNVQPELTNQTRQRINNIMRNWTF